MKIFALVNQKGGVGKTTSTVNIAAVYTRMGMRVLVLEVDPQNHDSKWLGCDKAPVTLYHIMKSYLAGRPIPLTNIIQQSREGIYIAPGSEEMAALEGDLKNDDVNGQYILAEVLKDCAEQYDIILIDCGPTLNMLTVNALTAATDVAIPVRMSLLDLDGVTHVLATVRRVSQRLNPTLKVAGVFATFADGTRRGLDVSDLALNNKAIGGYMLRSAIPQLTIYTEAVDRGVSVFGMGRGKDVRRAAHYYVEVGAELLWRSGGYTKQDIAAMIKMAAIPEPTIAGAKEVAYASA